MEKTALTEITKIKTNVVDNFNSIWTDLIALLPNIIGALLILLLGIIVAFIIKKISASTAS